MKRKFKLKWLVWLSGGVLLSSAVISPIVIVHNQKQNNHNLKADSNNSLPTEDSVNELLNDALTKISKKIYWLDHKEGNDNLAHDDVIKQTGAFLFNVNSQVASFKELNEQNKKDDPQAVLNVKYSTIMKEALNAGVDLNDYALTTNNKETMMESYMSTLIAAGVDPAQAKAKTEEFGKAYDTTTLKGKDELWDSFEFTYHLSTSVFNNGLSVNQIKNQNLSSVPTSVDMQKQAALNFAQNRLNKLLTTIPNSDFATLVKDYSATGKYDIGSEIDDNDLSKLFNFAYDRTEGATLSRVNLSDINIDVNNLQPGADGTYSSKLNQYEVKPLSTYSSYGATYGLAEIIPGYKLHMKIIGKDVWADSHKCHLDFQFGISTTITGEDPSVLWAPINKDAEPLSADVNVKKDQVKYISQNEYYTNQSVNIKAGSYNSKQDRYYDVDSQDVRTPLYYLMSMYGKEDDKQDYIVSKTDPMYVDPKSCNGIDIPQIDPTIPMKDGKFHANQQLKLVITDVNTNSEAAGLHAFAVLAHWAIIDQEQNDNGVPGSGPVYEAQTFNWNDSGIVKSDIWINFYVDPQWAKVIDYATHITDSMDKMNFFDYLNTTLKQNESNISQTIDQKIGFLASLNVAQAGLVALTSTETVILIASDGLAAPVAASIALNVAAVGLLITADVFEGTTIDEARDAKTIWEKFSGYYEENMKSTFAKAGGSILKQFSNIWDPHKDLLIKQQAANDVASSVTAITTDYQAFLANVTNVIFAADDAAEKENLPEWEKVFNSLKSTELYSDSFLLSAAVIPAMALAKKLWQAATFTWSRSSTISSSESDVVMPAAENFAFRELPSLAEQSNPIFCSSLPSLNVDLFASDAPASNAGAGVPAAAPRAAAVLPAPDGAAVGGVAAAGDASVALADQFKGGIIGVAIATALLAAATAIVAVVQFIIDGFSKIDFSDGTAKYAISPDKPNFAVDEHGNTVLGDEITFSVTELNSGTVLDGSKITWSVLSSSDKPENYVTLIGNKLRIDHLPKDSFDITIQAIIKDENGDKTLVVEFKIPLPNK